MAPPTAKQYPCITCNSHVKKNDKAVQCSLCDLWIHYSCSDMSEEMFKLLNMMKEQGDSHAWSCKCCKSAVQNLNKKVIALEKKMTEMRNDITSNSENITTTNGRVDNIEKDVDKLKSSVAQGTSTEKAEDAVFREMKDRETRKENIIIHGLQEPDSSVKGGPNRKKLDINNIIQILDSIGCKVDFDEDVKFCIRVGERLESHDKRQRPVIIGFREPKIREKILNSARKLSTTKFKDIGIVPDLTARQRREDAAVIRECEEKNNTISREEALNWEYKVVGPKGQKKMIRVKKFPNTATSTTGKRTRRDREAENSSEEDTPTQSKRR